MWKRKEDDTPTGATKLADYDQTSKETRMEPTKEVGHIGKSVLIKGELSGSEDLYIDGEIEGTIELRGHSLTIGPNGRIRANLNARDVVIHGKVVGNVHANERVDLRKTAVLTGNMATKRIAIEDGAFFKGGVDIQKDSAPV